MSSATQLIARQRVLLNNLDKRAYLLAADLGSNTLTDESRDRLENQLHQVAQQQTEAKAEIERLKQQPQQARLF